MTQALIPPDLVLPVALSQITQHVPVPFFVAYTLTCMVFS